MLAEGSAQLVERIVPLGFLVVVGGIICTWFVQLVGNLETEFTIVIVEMLIAQGPHVKNVFPYHLYEACGDLMTSKGEGRM